MVRGKNHSKNLNHWPRTKVKVELGDDGQPFPEYGAGYEEAVPVSKLHYTQDWISGKFKDGRTFDAFLRDPVGL